MMKTRAVDCLRGRTFSKRVWDSEISVSDGGAGRVDERGGREGGREGGRHLEQEEVDEEEEDHFGEHSLLLARHCDVALELGEAREDCGNDGVHGQEEEGVRQKLVEHGRKPAGALEPTHARTHAWWPSVPPSLSLIGTHKKTA